MEAAAAAAGMSERTARKWQRGPLPSETKEPRTWRTRPTRSRRSGIARSCRCCSRRRRGRAGGEDGAELAAGQAPGRVRPTGSCARCSGGCGSGGRCTARQGGVLRAGARARARGVVRLHPLRRAGRHHRRQVVRAPVLPVRAELQQVAWVELAFGETFEALVGRAAGRALGPRRRAARLAQDNLSAATHQLQARRPRADRALRGVARALRRDLDAHPAGRVARERRRREGARPAQVGARAGAGAARQPRLREVERTCAFVGDVVDERQPADRSAARRGAGGSPAAAVGAVPEYTTYTATCASGARSTSATDLLGAVAAHRPRGRGAAVPRRRRGLLPRRKTVETMPRSARRAAPPHRLPARDLVARAQARRLRALPLPRGAVPVARVPPRLRRARDARGERADVEYVRILHLAASTMEARVEEALVGAARARARRSTTPRSRRSRAPEQPAVPVVHIRAPDLAAYDAARRGRCRHDDRTPRRCARACASCCASFKLPTLADRARPRLTDGGHDDALPLVARGPRARGRRAPRATHRAAAAGFAAAAGQDLRDARPRRACRDRCSASSDELATRRLPRARGTTSSASGCPGVGKTHVAAALGHALVQAGRTRAVHADLPARAGAARGQARPRAAARARASSTSSTC